MQSFLASLVDRLAAAGARQEALGVREPARRVLGLAVRAERIVVVGRVWRLGDYLLEPNEELHRVGRVVRVAGTDRRRSIVAASMTARHELARAARRGGVPEGETVNFDVERLDPASLDPAVLEPYLLDRAELLVHPPGGA
ncbi:MAG: hypothetical protein BGO95_08500 [Micrococcales bacterium 73-13]|nr:MAG: hypothetical protein BGO95_08500 [Micrococcales bacterium 73-13]